MSQNKWTTQLMVITLSKPNRFSNFFTIEKKSKLQTKHIRYSTTTKVFCRTTCGKSKYKFVTSRAADRHLVDLLWCPSASRSLASRTSSLSIHPVMRDVSGDFFIFQQDSAPAHRARDTVQFLAQSTPSFIPPDLWPPNSTDLNPVDYKIWVTSSSKCISRSCTALTNWRSVCWTFGTAWTRVSLTMQLTGGVNVLEHVYRQKADISSSCCKLDNSVVWRTSWQDIIFRFIKRDVFLKLSQIETLNFHR